MKVVVSGYEDDVPIYNPRSLAFATHNGFRPLACRVRRPQTKGKVERPFCYVETSLFNGRSFESLDQHTRLRVDHHHGILEQIRGIDEPSIGRECDVANEIVHSALGFRHYRKDAPWRECAIGVLEFQNRSARATTHIHKIAFRRECEP